MSAETKSWVIMSHKDFLNLRKLGRSFPIVGDVVKTFDWQICTDPNGVQWKGLTPKEWTTVYDLIVARPKVLQEAQRLQIDVQMSDEL